MFFKHVINYLDDAPMNVTIVVLSVRPYPEYVHYVQGLLIPTFRSSYSVPSSG